MEKCKKKKSIILIIYLSILVVLMVTGINYISCIYSECSNREFENSLKLILTDNMLDNNKKYCDARGYNDNVFSSYLEDDNIETSKVYKVDECTIIQYYIDAETGVGAGVIMRRVDSASEKGKYSIIKMYYTGISPYGICAKYPTNYFYVWVSLESNCKPSKGLFHYVNQENYDVFILNYGEEIINDLHDIYLINTKKLLG